MDVLLRIVLKLNSKALAHKTEAGAVAINLADEAALTQALQNMQTTVAAHNPDIPVEHFLVEAMQPSPLAEMLVSVRRDSEFGWVMTLASGGVLVDLLADATTVLLPASRAELQQALASLSISKLLSGYRGKPAADIDMLVTELERLAGFAMAPEHEIEEIEINPLFVYTDKVCVVDVLMHQGR